MKEMCDDFVLDNCYSTIEAFNKQDMRYSETNMNGYNELQEQHDYDDEGMSLAQAYVPMQPYTTSMPPEQSLVCGTVFSDLLFPYCQGWHLYNPTEEGK